jgi:hypothetical protein
MLKIPAMLDKWRLSTGPGRSFPGEPFGFFLVNADRAKIPGIIRNMQLIVSCGIEPGGVSVKEIPGQQDIKVWEHVSATMYRYLTPNNKKYSTPTWDEMCVIKSLFWEPEDCVVQFHPPESNYVNEHKHVLHLWRPLEETMPMPPTIYV